MVASPATGYVTAMMCERIGTACVLLGGGREKKEDSVDPAVGIMVHKKLGDHVAAGEPLCTIHYNSAERLERVCPLILDSYTISTEPLAQQPPLVYRVIGDSGLKAATVR
jgi:thymidine phosphorylase